jgi:S-adenosylhomocysteine hydrolase
MDMEETLKIILDKLNSMDSDIKDLKKHVIVIENDHGKKLDALFDGYKQVYEKVVSIDEKVEKQDVEIRVIKGAK